MATSLSSGPRPVNVTAASPSSAVGDVSASSVSSSSASVRPLTGMEDLIVFFSLTKSFRKYASRVPQTYDHLIAHLPGPSLPFAPAAEQESLLLPLSYAAMPPPLQLRPLTTQQTERVLRFRQRGELGLVSAELQEKETRLRALEEERRSRKLEKRSKKEDKKRRQQQQTPAHGDGGGDDSNKRIRLDAPAASAGSGMVDIM